MQRKLFRPLAAIALLAVAVGAGTAQARDNVYWSLGVDAAPGVSLGVSNTRPVVVAPAPIVVAPQPVYMAPRPLVVHRPVMLVQEPVYVVRDKHKGHRHKHKHHRHHRHDD